MSGAQPNITLRSPGDCSKEDLSRFHDMVLEGGEVRKEGLDDRIGRAKVLAFLESGGAIIGVGALKIQHRNYTARLFKKANAKSVANDFGLELGWVVIGKAHRGHKHSSRTVDALLAHTEGKRTYATSVSTNERMHTTLIKHNFERDGAEWPSQKRKNTKLFLFVHKDSGPKV